MRITTGLFCLTALIVSAPAFAQAPRTAEAASLGRPAAADVQTSSSAGLLGVIDRLTINRGQDRSGLPLAPIETGQLALAWRPAGKWGISLDLTSRSPNDVLPREELSAGAYYQISPRFRFGGGVTLNGDNLGEAAQGWSRKSGEAGVRIESAFSF
jgi:hypothetical protein